MDDVIDRYCTVKEARKLLGVTTPTLRKWDTEGKITAIRAPSGMRRYSLEDIYNILGRDTAAFKEREKVIYCRVSSKKQSNDLERQVNILQSLYPDHTVVTDIGSGINWKRKGLQTILEQAMHRTISEVVVAHRDRLCRFAFELLEWMFNQCGVKLIVLDKDDCKSSDTELTDDILSIVHVYSCRNMGRRRYQNKKTENVPNCETTDISETVDGDC
jgi:predicted site-specific integrase-resolvase